MLWFCGTNCGVALGGLLEAVAPACLDLVERFVIGALVAGAVPDVEDDDGEFRGMVGDDVEFDFASLVETPIVEANFVDESVLQIAGRLEIARYRAAISLYSSHSSGERRSVREQRPCLHAF